jgi:hypothetical protein
MDAATLVVQYPRLWHMAEDGSWPSIRQRGLLSTSCLLDLYAIDREARRDIESKHRPESVPLARVGLPNAVVRDQKPMTDEGLRRCLTDGVTPEDWYRTLNSMCFFWLTEERLLTLLNARPYRTRPHTVLVVNTASLVNAHAPNVRLCPMNSGCTKPFPHPRGPNTFLTIEQYPFEARRTRGRDAIVELAVIGGLPDISEHVELVRRMTASEVLETIWAR